MRFSIKLLFLKIKKILMLKEEKKKMKVMKKKMTNVEAESTV
jgi:hypothetical protein